MPDTATLMQADIPVLAEPAAAISVSNPDDTDEALLLTADWDRNADRAVVALGTIPGLQRFTAIFRPEPWWNVPRVGTELAGVPAETQFLLAKCGDDRFVAIAPLIDHDVGMRASLEGAADGRLTVVIESGDPATVAKSALCAAVAGGKEPYAVLERLSRVIANRLPLCRLRVQKNTPDIINWFGWCTWDAFYAEVSQDKIRQGLESLKQVGVDPHWMILDDGWQQVGKQASGEQRLQGFGANDKFPDGLAGVARMVKDDFGLKRFWVWHAFQGYWGGVDGEALPAYNIRAKARQFSAGIKQHFPTADFDHWGKVCGVIDGRYIHRFYQDYHRYLASQGVDGVKVDNQSSLEGLCHGQNGRIHQMRAWREALEGAVQVHFQGDLINCMSCSTDVLYMTPTTTLMRTSTDFWPRRPDQHGLHIWTNAAVGLWYWHFVTPDWDMFWSKHPFARFHAVGRAVSGGPIYVSDPPGQHDPELLKQLVRSNGRVPRCDGVATPSPDSLFVDPVAEPVLYKVLNHTFLAGVVGAFNCQYHADDAAKVTVTGRVSPSDLVILEPEDGPFAVHVQGSNRLELVDYDAGIDLTLGEAEAALVTIVPIDNHIAPIGLVNFLNPSALVDGFWSDDTSYEVMLDDAGLFLAWTDRKPEAVFVDEQQSEFTFDPDRCALWVTIKDAGHHELQIVFPTTEDL